MKNWNGKPLWKRLAPALCALVLIAGGLWTGTLENGAGVPQNEMSAGMVTASRSASNSLTAKYSLTEESASYDSAAAYDMGVSTYGAVQQTQRKLVRSADLTIHTKGFDESLTQVKNGLADMGGYIENLYQYGETIRRVTLNMRVPSDKLDEFLLSLSGTGRVTNRSESTVDMTTQYYDNQARLDTLYQKRGRLNELLKQAQDVSDLIEIESAIADTQYQTDSYETSQRSIDREVDMSAVSLTLMEEEQTVVNPELTLGERIAAGFESSVHWLSGFARDVIVFVVMASPAIGVALAGWLIAKLIKKIRKREE